MRSINRLYVYTHRWDNDLPGWIPVEGFSLPSYPYPRDKEALPKALISNVRLTLKQCGWEGDGELCAMMVPPIFSSAGHTQWFPVFHVKQGHNGTSWIASEYRLRTANLIAESPRVRGERERTPNSDLRVVTINSLR